MGEESGEHTVSEDQVWLSVVSSVRHLVVTVSWKLIRYLSIFVAKQKNYLPSNSMKLPCEHQISKQCGIQRAMPRGPHLFWIGDVFTPKRWKREPKTQASSTPIKSPGLQFLSFSPQNRRGVNLSNRHMCKRLVQETWYVLWNSMAKECFHLFHEKNLSLNDFHMKNLVIFHVRTCLLSFTCCCSLN